MSDLNTQFYISHADELLTPRERAAKQLQAGQQSDRPPMLARPDRLIFGEVPTNVVEFRAREEEPELAIA